jgi:hypothetical protein
VVAAARQLDDRLLDGESGERIQDPLEHDAERRVVERGSRAQAAREQLVEGQAWARGVRPSRARTLFFFTFRPRTASCAS